MRTPPGWGTGIIDNVSGFFEQGLAVGGMQCGNFQQVFRGELQLSHPGIDTAQRRPPAGIIRNLQRMLESIRQHVAGEKRIRHRDVAVHQLGDDLILCRARGQRLEKRERRLPVFSDPYAEDLRRESSAVRRTGVSAHPCHGTRRLRGRKRLQRPAKIGGRSFDVRMGSQPVEQRCRIGCRQPLQRGGLKSRFCLVIIKRIEVFRDLGLAFAIVLLLIYVLVVGWFQSFTVPLVIMAPIPLTLIGILPGHAITGAFFTATSMIGMIALAGIIVRNSILLVDFIQLAEARGRTLREAVLEAGAVRFRPIALTAAAVVVGGLVMVLDPIFQGLAVALMSGAIVATLLTMVVVPILYWELRRRAPEGIPHQEHTHEDAGDRLQRLPSAAHHVAA